MGAAVAVDGVVKRYGDVTALEGVSLSVEPGEVHGLLGPNGAGKSTLMRVLLGLVEPDAGRVQIFGRDVGGADELPTRLAVAGFVDRPRFWPFLTARRTLEVLARADGLDDAPGADEVLARVGLDEVADRRVRGWSTGMLQRLAVAAALLRRPRLLVLDEPTEGLDPLGTAALLALLEALRADGVAVLLSSHDMVEVDRLCDTVTVVHRGRVVRDAPLADLRASLPTTRHRLRTSDDDAAAGVAARHPVALAPTGRGDLVLDADPDALAAFVCDLGRHDVAVLALAEEEPPLVALFHQLTGAA